MARELFGSGDILLILTVFSREQERLQRWPYFFLWEGMMFKITVGYRINIHSNNLRSKKIPGQTHHYHISHELHVVLWSHLMWELPYWLLKKKKEMWWNVCFQLEFYFSLFWIITWIKEKEKIKLDINIFFCGGGGGVGGGCLLQLWPRIKSWCCRYFLITCKTQITTTSLDLDHAFNPKHRPVLQKQQQ